MRDLRARFWGPDQLPDDMEDTENILEVPQRPALMTALISDLHITIDKPSFPPSQLPEFMHRVGKGLPYDTKFSLLVPMFVQLDMGEARVTLRDYPLPLLHVPAIKPGQSPRVSAWSLKTDFVIGEEYQGPESLRNVKVVIIPPLNREPGTTNKGAFAFNVRRTVSPVKTYSDIKVNINTGFPTRITWGASYQPAIQDMMLIIESFTKPQIDPSDRVGFWDKIRLSFHSRLTVAWTGDGDVHLLLKGTRDPYMVTGNGAGFLMCWRNDVKWNIARNNDSRSLITVDSNEYILAIPDYSHQARRDYHHAQHDDSSISSEGSFKRGATFKKVVMKLSGNVQWMAGLMFERNVGSGGQRSFDFEPHYKVVFKEPKYAKSALGIEYDAFRGFRSNHIHMSIAVRAPVNREWEPSNTTPSLSYNTVHLTPRFFTHFFAWWAMFGGTMSLPIRQGPLWPGIEKSSKKFGRHLSTIKYNLLLAPLFLSHIYKHTNPEDYGEDIVSATGLKMRLDSFMLDMHQRREEFHTQDKGQKTATKTSSLKMHQAQLDLVSADIRAVSASIVGTTSEDLQKASDSASVGQDEHVQTDLSNFEIPDNDFSWIDMDDFIELDWILPSTGNPETKIMPLAYAPRFTYFRQTNHGDTISGDPDRTSPFGSEPTHFCVMSKDDDPRRVQCHLIENRLKQLEGQMNDHTRQWDEAELERIRSNHSPASTEAYDQLNRHGVVLKEKKVFLESMLHQMAIRIHTNLKRAVPDEDADVDSDRGSPRPKDYDKETDDIGTNPGAEFVSDFNNRFVIHNMQLKWNNLLRNIILRYIHQVSQRRGFVYYLSRRAVKFILDIVEEQNKAKANARSRSASAGPRKSTPSSASPVDDSDEMIREIIADGKRFVDADDPQAPEITKDPAANNMSSEFTPQNSYHLRLIAPQIQLQSEKNPKSVVLVTAKGMELKVVEVMDKDRMFDDVSGLVQRRFCVEMDSTQFFVTHQKWFSLQLLSMYSGVNYGTPSGSAWPPWVPMEVMFDFQGDPFGFKRVVQKTSASLRFDKYNTLRLKYNDEINKDGKRTTNTNDVEDRMDHLWVEFPQIRAICNSSQYYAMYIIVLDLLMYSEPLEKTRTERLERIMLASDFSDLSGAPDMVIRLQERIRQLDEIKTQFQINSKDLDKRGWEDRLVLDKDLASCEDELFFMMKAITTSQRKYDGSQTSGLLRWNISSQQIVWHLIRDNNEPLMEFQLQGAEYDRTDNSDGSHLNLMQIGKIIGLNLLDDAIYPEMFAPYADAERGTFNEGGNQQMLRVYWHMLEAIAGIPVMSHFEVNLFPMKIQLEREVGKKLFEYMFPGTKDDKGQGPKKKSPSPSPFIVMNMVPVEDDEVEEAELEAQAKAKAEAAAISSSNAAQQLSARPGVDRMATVANTRAGSLELRLKPTLTSEDHPAIAGSSSTKTKASSMHSNNEGHFRIFQSNSKSGQASRNTSGKSLTKKTSLESMKSAFTTPHPGVARSSTHNSVADSNSVASSDTKKRGFIGLGSSKSKKEQPSDDLTRMMARASNYMTLAYVKIPSVVLCLSYKGKGDRNIEDVHDFVFRLPMIEYRNKTWSNLDLALALKKDIIRALISHTGAIIGNKFSKHRPNTAQQTRLRELATSSMLLAPVEGQWDSDTSSLFGTSPTDNKSESRRSFASSRNGDIKSDTNSMYSEHSGNTTASRAAFANSMAMTKNYSGDGSRSTVVAAKEGITQAEDDRELAETQEGKHGFMANTIQRFRNGTGAGSSSSYIGEREGEGTVRKKPKSLLGNILGSSTQS
ncbi:golgi-body localization protein domain-containing protein [Calycina marina]|uniref:Golgi-body localization protein domain-containing protein n=1 Tax=Calycina marina TaxID=1763456 RepID=A0A9P7YZE0_9HELO|nr:golgi-body localization protein domain-containing protein [Calycina marina]